MPAPARPAPRADRPRRQSKSLDVLTLFHAPKNEGSVKVLELLRGQSEKATRRSIFGSRPAASFEIDVVEAPTVPTADQFRSILEFVGPGRVGDIVKGAHYNGEALKALQQGSAGSALLTRPLLVDWNNGRAGTCARADAGGGAGADSARSGGRGHAGRPGPD